jgi:hypothetical protein
MSVAAKALAVVGVVIDIAFAIYAAVNEIQAVLAQQPAQTTC